MSLVLVKNACREILRESIWKDESRRTMFRMMTQKVSDDGSVTYSLSTLNGSQICFLLKGCRIIKQSSQSLFVETSRESRDFLKSFWKTLCSICIPLKSSHDLTEEQLEEKFTDISIWISRKEFSDKIYSPESMISCFMEVKGLWKKSSSSSDIHEWHFNFQAKMITITSRAFETGLRIEDDL
jgi:hypothetical protein